jgi:hypothetical protein
MRYSAGTLENGPVETENPTDHYIMDLRIFANPGVLLLPEFLDFFNSDWFCGFVMEVFTDRRSVISLLRNLEEE